ncbi:hypothetical protein DYL59_02105 [Pseudomonas kairouanensis]|uniref:Uncharacterized protein n=1 Tax=Pseudomonas kairouanensis TaxID=2293832 RepID=A0A4Z0B3I2_9PSED|nr:hypothetical protein [Pseudomonas kairouanensis]TFY92778.1 hypothetical protein DYL59_02105 [Pseudomonas kairouanensis]
MNNALIDQQILELLRIPANRRTPDDIAKAINGIAAAAQLETAPLCPIQHEVLKLQAIVEFLAEDMRAEEHSVTLELSPTGDDWRAPLSTLIKLGPGSHLIGFGKTAEEVLRNLRKPSWDKVSA